MGKKRTVVFLGLFCFIAALNICLSSIWTDLSFWTLAGIDVLSMMGIAFSQTFFVFSQQQKILLEDLKNVKNLQKDILTQIQENPFLTNKQNTNKPEENSGSVHKVSQAVLSELQFMSSLMQQISECYMSTSSKESSSVSPVSLRVESGHSPFDKKGGKKTEETSRPLNRAELLLILQKALKSDRIEMLLQPIVSLPQRKRRHCECFSRIRDEENGIIHPDHYLKIAQDEFLISIIDNTLVFRCIQLLRKALQKNLSMNFFCNISTHSLKNEKFRQGLKDFFDVNPRLARHIIFEIDQFSLKEDYPSIQKALRELTHQGCSFSLDNVHDLSSIAVKELKKVNFKYIKIDASVLLKILSTPEGPGLLKNFKKKTDQEEIDIILTKIEEEKQLIELLEFNFDFGQGYLFSPPTLSSY